MDLQQERESLCKLSLIDGIGPATIEKLRMQFGSYSEVLQNSFSKWNVHDGIKEKYSENSLRQLYDQQFTQLNEEKVEFITILDNNYPESLKNITTPPVVLFYKGNISLLNQKSIAVVGTRIPTPYSDKICLKLIPELVNYGFCIISGFQRGVDQIAHKEAIKNNGRTIAVLGTGIDEKYPSNYREMHKLFGEKNLIITEFPFHTKPFPGNFPSRNRIVAGLSQGVLVIEAAIKSGSLNTASHALEQGKDVWCVPGSIFSNQSTGTNYLIQQGAKLITSTNDILGDNIQRREAVELPVELNHAKDIYIFIQENNPDLDQILTEMSYSAKYVLPILSELELIGMIKKMEDSTYIIL